MVRVQMGLLQEAILTNRIGPYLQSTIVPWQSGYVRGVEDAMIALHETTSLVLAEGRCVWSLFGDFVRAFPRVWRDDLLVLLSGSESVRGGSYALLADMFTQDNVHVAERCIGYGSFVWPS